ncbi:MAG: hypothetical protein R2711_00375 [Acidimicrobiales bacterium]
MLRIHRPVPLRGLLAGPRPGARRRGGGVAIYAPEYLRSQYPGDEGVVLDVADELGESLSVETELGCRLILRGAGFDSSTEPQACEVPAVAIDRGIRGELPEALRGLRMR